MECFAHRASGGAVRPFVKFPFLIPTQLIELGESQKFTTSHFVKTKPVNETHPHATDEWPYSAVMIMMGKVQQIDRVVRPPIGVAGLHNRIEVRHRVGLIHSYAPHESKGNARPIHIEDIHEESEHVGVNVAAPVERKRGDFRQKILGVT